MWFCNFDPFHRKLDVPDVKYEVFYNPKSLGKLVARLIKKFELPQDLATNLNKKRTGGALQFLIRKRYKDNLSKYEVTTMGTFAEMKKTAK